MSRRTAPSTLTIVVMLMMLLIATNAWYPRPARGDGDPASDILLTEDVFYPFTFSVSRLLQRDLNQAVARAHAAHFPIKVALIESPSDLGALPQLFGKPQAYAKFLDVEISYSSVPKLLVVMPQGFGTAAVASPAALNGITIPTDERSSGLAAAAIEAVVKLAAAAGHPIATPVAAKRSGASFPWIPVLAGLTAVAAAATATMRRRRA